MAKIVTIPGDAGAVFIENDGAIVIVFHEAGIRIPMTSEQLRKFAQELCETAIRMDCR